MEKPDPIALLRGTSVVRETNGTTTVFVTTTTRGTHIKGHLASLASESQIKMEDFPYSATQLQDLPPRVNDFIIFKSLPS